MTKRPVITYLRVSMSLQGRSGLGIEAQRQSLEQFAKAEGLEPLREFIEVETGKGSDALDRRHSSRPPSQQQKSSNAQSLSQSSTV
jgi:DNA invertase Pin-like site-specific DNA recombinase